jgi:hypothetical protein
MAIDPYSANVAGQYLGLPTDEQMSPGAGGEAPPLSPEVAAALKSTMAASAPATPLSTNPGQAEVPGLLTKLNAGLEGGAARGLERDLAGLPDITQGGSASTPPAAPPAKPKLTVDQALDLAIQKEGGPTGKSNPTSGAYGLIGFMPGVSGKAVAKRLGISEDELKRMSPEEQRQKAVPAFFDSIGHPLATLAPEDVGLAIGASGMVGKPDDTPIKDDKYGAWAKGSKPWDQNPAWRKIAESHGRDYLVAGDLREYYGAGKADDSTTGQPPRDTGATTPTGAAYAASLGGGRGTAERTTISTATHEGIPYTPEDRTALSDISKNAIAANETASLAKQAQLDQQRADLLVQQQKDQERADAAEARKFASQQYYNESKNRIAEAQKAVDEDKAPKPFGGNVFAGILAAIAMGLGAYGASITKTRNFAADIINQQLDRDMKGWEQKHLDLKFKVQNAHELSRDRASTTVTTEREPGKGYDLSEVTKQDEAARTAGVSLKEREAIRKANKLQERLPLTEKQQKQAETLAERYGRVTNAEEAIHGALDTLDKYKNTPGGVPGLGPLGSRVPDMAYSILDRIGGAGKYVGLPAAEIVKGYGETARQVRQQLQRALTIAIVKEVGMDHVGLERNNILLNKLSEGGLEEADVRKHLEEVVKTIDAAKKKTLAMTDDEAVRRQVEENAASYAPTENAKPYTPGAP